MPYLSIPGKGVADKGELKGFALFWLILSAIHIDAHIHRNCLTNECVLAALVHFDQLRGFGSVKCRDDKFGFLRKIAGNFDNGAARFRGDRHHLGIRVFVDLIGIIPIFGFVTYFGICRQSFPFLCRGGRDHVIRHDAGLLIPIPDGKHRRGEQAHQHDEHKQD
ncbi:MAG: hypothetical protein IKO00_02360 [Oscillospiraceae bacterium]|nr:hypothetical protein [Oscillospiraceae bacterium]